MRQHIIRSTPNRSIVWLPVIATALAMLLFARTTLGHVGYLQQFSNLYPASTADDAACAVCHSDANGGRPWNAYGRDILANGGAVGPNGDVVPALLSIQSLNSDAVAGDNLTEINDGAQPGWCDVATIGCSNQLYNANGSNAGTGTPPTGLVLDDDSQTSMAPNIEVVQASVNFGSVLLNTTVSTTVTINNTGNLALENVSADVSGSAFFAIDTPPDASVPAGGSTSIVISYSPSTVGTDTGTLSISSNDPDEPQLDLTMMGIAIDEPPETGNECPIGNPLTDPIPAPISVGPINVGLQTVATGFVNPVLGISAPGDRRHLFVVDQPGQIWRVNLSTGSKSLFLDVSSRLVELGLFGINYDERGLLGAAFAPDYFRSGLIYTYESVPVNGSADFSTMQAGEVPDHQSVVVQWRVSSPRNSNAVVDINSARELLRIDQPEFNHNGGTTVFGPDNLLYITLGDGGGADDQGDAGHSEQGNGQDTSNILGSIIRIDPRSRNSINGQYGIPPSNPFANLVTIDSGTAGGQPGCTDGYCDEIYAFGFRNGWRASFDTGRSGTLIVADVGQNDIEEIDIVRAGGNYGWRIKDGSFCFDANGDDRGFVSDATYTPPPDIIDPVAEYDHDEGISVTGGFVYRGRAIKQLHGHYVFGDWAPSFVDPVPGRLFYLSRKNLRSDDTTGSEILEMRLPNNPDGVGSKINGFGQDAVGELYIIGSERGLLEGETGVVQKIIPSRR